MQADLQQRYDNRFPKKVSIHSQISNIDTLLEDPRVSRSFQGHSIARGITNRVSRGVLDKLYLYLKILGMTKDNYTTLACSRLYRSRFEEVNIRFTAFLRSTLFAHFFTPLIPASAPFQIKKSQNLLIFSLIFWHMFVNICQSCDKTL